MAARSLDCTEANLPQAELAYSTSGLRRVLYGITLPTQRLGAASLRRRLAVHLSRVPR
jgi:hypothetical protein